MRALSLRVFLGLALSAGLWVLPATGSPVTRLGAPGLDGEPGYVLALSAFLGWGTAFQAFSQELS